MSVRTVSRSTTDQGHNDSLAWNGTLSAQYRIATLLGDEKAPIPEQILREAAAAGDLETMKVLLNTPRGYDVFSANSATGRTALHYAATADKNAKEAVTLLIKEIDRQEEAGETEEPGSLALLMRDKHGNTALDLAKEAGAEGTAKRLEQAATRALKREMEKIDGDRDWGKIVKLIGEGGGDIDAIIDKIPVKRIGEFKDPLKMFKRMVDSGAVDLVKTRMGTQSLYAYFRFTDNFWGENSRPKGSEHFTKIADYITEEGERQIGEAFKKDNWERAENLIENTNADPMARYTHLEADNVSLLAYAAGKGKLDVVKAFLESIPEKAREEAINAQGSGGRTALHAAADGGHEKVVEYLISQGGQIDIEDDNGKTVNEILTGFEDEEPQTEGVPPTEDTKRPEGDTRSAEEIINDPDNNGAAALRGLSERHRRWLKNGYEWPEGEEPDNAFKGIGDYETDADAAYRAVQFLAHIERYDQSGAIMNGDDVGNGRIDGFTRDMEARPDTEAARFQDFCKYGYGYTSLGKGHDTGNLWETWDKTKQPEHLYRTSGGRNGGGIEVDYEDVKPNDPLRKTHETESIKALSDFYMKLEERGYEDLINDAELPEDRADILRDPSKYSTEQRAAAAAELLTARNKLIRGISNYKDLPSKVKLNPTDPQAVLEDIEWCVTRILGPEGPQSEVNELLNETLVRSMQAILHQDPRMRQEVRGLLDDITEDAAFLKRALDNSSGELVDRLSNFSELVTNLNVAAGSSGQPYLNNLTINIWDSEELEESGYLNEILEEMDTTILDNSALSNLVEGGMPLEEAMAEINSRAVTFMDYGIDPQRMQNAVNDNIVHYRLKNADGNDLHGILTDENDELDTDIIEKIVAEFVANNPDSPMLKDENGITLSKAQIVNVVRNTWDTIRHTGKWNSGSKDPNNNHKPFLSKNNPISANYSNGPFHLVSSMLAMGVMIAKAAKKPDDPAVIISTIASGMQFVGQFGEASAMGTRWEFRPNVDAAKAFRTKWERRKYNMPERPAWNKTEIGKADRQKIVNFTNYARLLTASASVLLLGTATAMATKEFKDGNPALGAVYMTAGIANFASTPSSLVQATQRMWAKWAASANSTFNLANPESNRLFRIGQWGGQERNIKRIVRLGGRIGLTTNAVASLLFMGVFLYDVISEEISKQKYLKGFTGTLEDYGVTGFRNTDADPHEGYEADEDEDA